MSQEIPLETSLEKHFNHNTFRIGQKEIIEDVINGNDVLGILPTGSGKSLCYQLPAKLLEGTTIVVSPLISLMMDQVNQLKANNFKEVVALNSFMEYKERRHVYQNLAKYKLIYVSPELLQQSDVLGYLKELNISLFVIDEAHCISQWGHEFRPDYLRLKNVIDQLGNPPILALSATATASIQIDIITALNRSNMVKHIYPVDRKNIAFCINEVESDLEKQKEITSLLSNYNVPTLIFFSSRRSTESISRILSDHLPSMRIAFYHGGMDRLDRIMIQQQFMNDQLDVICCTSAFGMGIDKDNIRLVIHYHFPSQIESYIQEVGRAGRDGAESVSMLFYSRHDEHLPNRMIQNELPTEDNISFTLQQLHKLVQEDKHIPKNEQEIESMFQLNETQWRFIYYQFEKNGIIVGNHIHYDQGLWVQAFKRINNHRKSRLILKQSKLTEMIKWMNEKECLRKHLYKGFQDSYQKPIYQCCSNCSFSLSNWTPEQTIVKDPNVITWESKLKAVLLIGVYDETE